MRLINADELKKTIIETLERIRKNPKMSRDEMHILAACDTMCQMIDDMPTVPKQDFCKTDNELRKRQWISVKDRLPETKDPVLVSSGDNNVGIGMYDTVRDVWWSVEKNICYWQPFPEPPKEREENAR